MNTDILCIITIDTVNTPKIHSTVNTHKIYDAFYKKAQHSHQIFSTKHPHAEEFFNKKNIPLAAIRDHALKLITSGVLSTSIFLSSPALAQLPAANNLSLHDVSPATRMKMFSNELQILLPPTLSNLSTERQQTISELIWTYWGIDARTTLQGERLNHHYGYIGAEQHLPRYPGDTASEHEKFIEAGITPGKGAWGYFAPSKNDLTPDLIEKEKYYVAVQTLYLPEWNTRTYYLKDWYKYRKVVVINPHNGKTIIADIADAGPAAYTGKHFGGSPEIMAYLDLNRGMKKGAVLLYFVEDPENSIPLGPVEYNKNERKPLAHQ